MSKKQLHVAKHVTPTDWEPLFHWWRLRSIHSSLPSSFLSPPRYSFSPLDCTGSPHSPLHIGRMSVRLTCHRYLCNKWSIFIQKIFHITYTTTQPTNQPQSKIEKKINTTSFSTSTFFLILNQLIFHVKNCLQMSIKMIQISLIFIGIGEKKKYFISVSFPVVDTVSRSNGRQTVIRPFGLFLYTCVIRNNFDSISYSQIECAPLPCDESLHKKKEREIIIV